MSSAGGHAFRTRVLGATCALLALGAAPALAEDEREPGWYDQAELSLVQTGGNTESSTFGFENTLERLFASARFSFVTKALRAESSTFTRTAVGTPESFVVDERRVRELTAERYLARLRFDRELSPHLFWFAQLGWERNEFAGFTDRVTAVGGVGHVWWQRDDGSFRTDYGVTLIDQTDVVDDPKVADSSLGAQLSWEYARAFGQRARYRNVLVVNESLDETSDLRADMTNSVQVSMTERVALKVSLQLLYDNLPALAAVPLRDESGAATGERVLVPLDELDSVFTAAVVVSF